MKFLRKLLPSWVRRDLRRRIDTALSDPCFKVERIGNEGAAWWICPDLVQSGCVLVSGGVGNDVSFEREMVSRYHCQVHLFDPSPTGLATMGRPENQISGMHFNPLGLAGKAGPVGFSAPENAREGSFTIESGTGTETSRFECVRLSDVARSLSGFDQGILKLDIEGFEYEVLADLIVENRMYPRQICVEYHHFLRGISILKTLRSVRMLKNAGYSLVHKSQCDFLFVRR